MQIQQQYGTEAIQRFALRVLDLANVDKNADGKVDAQEWGQLVFGLVPELLNIKQLNNEVRDLTVQEVTDIVMLVGANFPDYLNLKTEVENVIRLALKFLAVTTSAGYDLLLAIKALNKTPVELEVNTDALPKPVVGTKGVVRPSRLKQQKPSLKNLNSQPNKQ